jgi:hypothetical protein
LGGCSFYQDDKEYDPECHGRQGTWCEDNAVYDCYTESTEPHSLRLRSVTPCGDLACVHPVEYGWGYPLDAFCALESTPEPDCPSGAWLCWGNNCPDLCRGSKVLICRDGYAVDLGEDCGDPSLCMDGMCVR